MINGNTLRGGHGGQALPVSAAGRHRGLSCDNLHSTILATVLHHRVAMEDERYLYALLGVTVGCYAGIAAIVGVLFYWFNPGGADCSFNVSVIVLTILVCLTLGAASMHPAVRGFHFNQESLVPIRSFQSDAGSHTADHAGVPGAGRSLHAPRGEYLPPVSLPSLEHCQQAIWSSALLFCLSWFKHGRGLAARSLPRWRCCCTRMTTLSPCKILLSDWVCHLVFHQATNASLVPNSGRLAALRKPRLLGAAHFNYQS